MNVCSLVYHEVTNTNSLHDLRECVVTEDVVTSLKAEHRCARA